MLRKISILASAGILTIMLAFGAQALQTTITYHESQPVIRPAEGTAPTFHVVPEIKNQEKGKVREEGKEERDKRKELIEIIETTKG